MPIVRSHELQLYKELQASVSPFMPLSPKETNIITMIYVHLLLASFKYKWIYKPLASTIMF